MVRKIREKSKEIPVTFKELKKALEEQPGIILSLGESADGGIKIVHNFRDGRHHTIALSAAKMFKDERPGIIFIKALF
jgi:hypothetical protein